MSETKEKYLLQRIGELVVSYESRLADSLIVNQYLGEENESLKQEINQLRENQNVQEENTNPTTDASDELSSGFGGRG